MSLLIVLVMSLLIVLVMSLLNVFIPMVVYLRQFDRRTHPSFTIKFCDDATIVQSTKTRRYMFEEVLNYLANARQTACIALRKVLEPTWVDTPAGTLFKNVLDIVFSVGEGERESHGKKGGEVSPPLPPPVPIRESLTLR